MYLEAIEDNIKKYFPVWASITGVIFNSIALLLEIDKFKELGLSNWQIVLLILFFSLVVGGFFTFTMYKVARKNSQKKSPDDFEIHEQEEELYILDNLGKTAVYKRFIKIIPKKDIYNLNVTTLPITTGTIAEIKCTKIDKNRKNIQDYDISINRIPKKAIHIFANLKKSSEYHFLCQWKVINGFLESEDGIGIKPLSKQKKCMVKIFFPLNTDFAFAKSMINFDFNNMPINEFDLEPVTTASNKIVQFDFSDSIKKEYDITFSILWKINRK